MSQEDCDKKLASIFGGGGAQAASLTEPSTLQHPDPRIPGSNRAGHLANSGAFHLYTNAQGTEATVGLYAPPGWIGGTPQPRYQVDEYTGDEQLYFSFRYRGGLSINFVHVGGTGANDAININRRDRNGAGSIRIGNIAGAGTGGEGRGYNHAHIVVRRNGVRGV